MPSHRSPTRKTGTYYPTSAAMAQGSPTRNNMAVLEHYGFPTGRYVPSDVAWEATQGILAVTPGSKGIAYLAELAVRKNRIEKAIAMLAAYDAKVAAAEAA